MKIATCLLALTLFLGVLVTTFQFQPVKAEGTIYIRADGSIDPSTAPIQRNGDTYAFISDIYGSILVQRNDVLIDGNGYALQGSGNGTGIDLAGRSNVTVKDLTLIDFSNGIWLAGSTCNNIFGCNVTEITFWATVLYYSSNNNSIFNNSLTSCGSGITLYNSSFNIVFDNDVINNTCGIRLYSYSTANSLFSNELLGNDCGVYTEGSSANAFYHNNFVNNSRQVELYSSENVWDDGYPSGGNFWSDYNGTDYCSGIYQNSTVFYDHVGDTPYTITVNNSDRYPLVLPWLGDWSGRSDSMFAIAGDSMAPTIVQNDFILVRNTTDAAEISAGPYPQGDIVLHRDAFNPSVLIVRRALEKWFESGTWHFTVKSDNRTNEVNITMNLIIGKIVYILRRYNVTADSSTYHPTIFTNSALEDLTYDKTSRRIAFNVAGTLTQNTTSYCEVYIPKNLLNPYIDVKVDGASIPFARTDYGRLILVIFEINQNSYNVNITEDDAPSVICTVVQTPQDNVQPDQPVAVSASVIDYGSDVKNVTLHYTNDTTWYHLSMTRNATDDAWETTIPGHLAGTTIVYYIEAYDNCENRATSNTTGYNYTYQVVPESLPLLAIPLLMATTAVATIVYRRRRKWFRARKIHF